MRLIDADRFKENILSGLYIYCQENKEDIARAIDDEPIIEPNLKLFKEWKCADCEERERAYDEGYQKAREVNKFTLDDVENYYRMGLEKGLSEWETERPQGELIKTDWYDEICGYSYECSHCHSLILSSHYNFCAACGADLRGENNG